MLGIWLIQGCPVLLHPSLDTWQKLPKAPKQKPPEPGSRRSLSPKGVSCWLQKELTCLVPVSWQFYPKNTLLVWLDPQAYLLGETVRFKEHKIPIRIFFNGLCLVVRWRQSDCPQFGVWATLAHTAAQQCQHISSAQKWKFCLLLALQDEDRNTIQALWKPPNFIHYEGQIVTEGLTFPWHFVLNIILMLLKTCIIAEV